MKKNIYKKTLTALTIIAIAFALPAFVFPAFARENESNDSVLKAQVGVQTNLHVENESEDINDDHGNDGDENESDDDNSSSSNSASSATSADLSTAVNALLAKMSGMSNAEFCANVSAAVNKLTPAERASLAWKGESYSKNLGLGVSANATADEKAEYESLKNSYSKISDSIATDDKVTSADKAAIRAAYLELMAEYRNGKVDGARASAIRGFIQKAASCLNNGHEISAAVSGSSSDDALKSRFEKLIEEKEHVKDISSDDSKVKTVYKQRGKLFGFIPVWMNVRSEVRAGGTAEVHYPWYSFLARVVGGKVSSETVLENTASVSKSDKLSTSDQEAVANGTIKAFESVELK